MQIHEAIAAIMGEVGSIKKDRTNSGQGYKFRGIDDVYLAIHDLFVKHGVFSVPTVMEERTEDRTTAKGTALIYRVLKIRYDFFARDGSSISSVVIGEGMDSGDKASNKAMSVGHKYAILQLLAIPTEDTVDPEIDSHEVAPRSKDHKTRTDPSHEQLTALIKGLLADLDPDGTMGLRQAMWDSYPGDLVKIAQVLEGMQIDAVQTKKNPAVAAVQSVFAGETF